MIIVFINHHHVCKAFLEPAVSSFLSHSPKQSRTGHGCLDVLPRSDNRLGILKLCCTFQVLKVCPYQYKLQVIWALTIFAYLYLPEINTTVLNLRTHPQGLHRQVILASKTNTRKQYPAKERVWQRA